jgi:hypothetical protein
MTISGIVAGWVVHQLNWIRQRHAFLRRPGIEAFGYHDPNPIKPLPLSLRLFGEPDHQILRIPDADHDLAKRLFPEAILSPQDPEHPGGPPH